MKRLRTIKKWGNSLVIILTSVDAKDLELAEGDIVDVSELTKEGKKRDDKKK